MALGSNGNKHTVGDVLQCHAESLREGQSTEHCDISTSGTIFERSDTNITTESVII